jgi:peroxiredoxin
MAVAAGDSAPDFTLPNPQFEAVRLRDLLASGPVVLAFFPAAFSSTCTSELCTLRDSLDELARAGGRVVGISVDTPFTLKAFQRESRLPFPLLSDFNKDVIRAYGVLLEDMIGLRGLAKRSVFLIDARGVVRHAEVLEDARDEPDYDALRRAVGQL